MFEERQIRAQRSVGDVQIRMERSGIAVLREAGSAKCRLVPDSDEAIMINTSGGIAGGDRISISAETGPEATLIMTSQAAERVYRAVNEAAEVRVTLKAEKGSTLFWLPQETILYDQSRLSRTLQADIADDAHFMIVESFLFGRLAMGESIQGLQVSDRWSIRCGSKIIHSEALRLGPQLPQTPAALGGNLAMATLFMCGPGAERKVEALRSVLGPHDAVSAWNGKVIARFMASDGFHLRKALIPAISVGVAPHGLPKTWTY